MMLAHGTPSGIRGSDVVVRPLGRAHHDPLHRLVGHIDVNCISPPVALYYLLVRELIHG